MQPYNGKRSSFGMKHFQSKSFKSFGLHPLLRRLVSFVAQIITSKVRCWVTDTQTKYCNPRCACMPRVNKLLYFFGQTGGFDGVHSNPPFDLDKHFIHHLTVHFKCPTIWKWSTSLDVENHHCPDESGQWLQLCEFVHGGPARNARA